MGVQCLLSLRVVCVARHDTQDWNECMSLRELRVLNEESKGKLASARAAGQLVDTKKKRAKGGRKASAAPTGTSATCHSDVSWRSGVLCLWCCATRLRA